VAPPCELPIEDISSSPVTVSFGPGERHAVAWAGPAATAHLLELEQGRVEPLQESERTASWNVRAWSPSGRRAVADDGWLDLTATPPVFHPFPDEHLRAYPTFPSEQRVVWLTNEGEEVRRLDLPPP
jgi:hypothetical protein